MQGGDPGGDRQGGGGAGSGAIGDDSSAAHDPVARLGAGPRRSRSADMASKVRAGGVMQVLIVYESIFGNTHRVAGAIARGIRDAAAGTVVNCVPVSRATPDLVAAADLLVVGGPTHARGMTFTRSRGMRCRVSQRTRRKANAAGATQNIRSTRTQKARPAYLVPRRPQGGQGPPRRRLRHPARHPAGRRRREGHRPPPARARLQPRRRAGGLHRRGGEGPMRAGELDRAHDWAAALVGAGVPAG